MAHFETSPHFSDQDKRVLRFTAGLSRTPAEVPDGLYGELSREFSERQLVELTTAIAWENYRARFNRAFAVEAEGFSTNQFCPLPERP